MAQETYMYGRHDDDEILTVDPEIRVIQKQHKMDSLMESICNVAVGFIISWGVWVFIVAPLFDLPNGAGTSFLITCVFTVTSLIRQYVLRRIFDGKTIWETIRDRFFA